MRLDFIISIISLIVSVAAAGFSWYYARESKKASAQTIILKEQQMALLVDQRNHQFIIEACEAFQKEGTPLHYIEALPLNADEKENLWQATFQRHKQRNPKRTFLQEKAENKK